MRYTISTRSGGLLLTLKPDFSINSPTLSQTELILNRMITSPIMAILIDFARLPNLTFRGSWTILQIVFRAQEYGKSVFFSNIQASIEPMLVETGILSRGKVVRSTENFDSTVPATHLPKQNTSIPSVEAGVAIH